MKDKTMICDLSDDCNADCYHKHEHNYIKACEDQEWRQVNGCPRHCSPNSITNAEEVHEVIENTTSVMKLLLRDMKHSSPLISDKEAYCDSKIKTQEPKWSPTGLKFAPEGLNPDAPIVTNERGGQQSKVDYRFDLLDAGSMFRMAKIMEMGSHTHKSNNWRKIDASDHINHALGHIWGYMLGDKQGDHLAHAAVRLMMAMAVSEDK